MRYFVHEHKAIGMFLDGNCGSYISVLEEQKERQRGCHRQRAESAFFGAGVMKL